MGRMDVVKRPRGRPSTGQKVEVRLPAEVIAYFDRMAEANGLARAQVIRSVLVRLARKG